MSTDPEPARIKREPRETRRREPEEEPKAAAAASASAHSAEPILESLVRGSLVRLLSLGIFLIQALGFFQIRAERSQKQADDFLEISPAFQLMRGKLGAIRQERAAMAERQRTSHASLPSAVDDAEFARRDGRRVNAWIENDVAPLTRGRSYRLGLNIGASRSDALGSRQMPPLDWGERPTLDLLVMLSGSDFQICPRSHRIQLPRIGDTDAVYYSLTPMRAAATALRISLYLIEDFALLEEFEVPIRIAEPAMA